MDYLHSYLCYPIQWFYEFLLFCMKIVSPTPTFELRVGDHLTAMKALPFEKELEKLEDGKTFIFDGSSADGESIYLHVTIHKTFFNATVLVTMDGEQYSTQLKGTYDSTEGTLRAAGLLIEVREAFRRWRVSYKGHLSQTNSDQDTFISFAGWWKPLSDARYVYSNMPASAVTTDTPLSVKHNLDIINRIVHSSDVVQFGQLLVEISVGSAEPREIRFRGSRQILQSGHHDSLEEFAVYLKNGERIFYRSSTQDSYQTSVSHGVLFRPDAKARALHLQNKEAMNMQNHLLINFKPAGMPTFPIHKQEVLNKFSFTQDNKVVSITQMKVNYALSTGIAFVRTVKESLEKVEQEEIVQQPEITATRSERILEVVPFTHRACQDKSFTGGKGANLARLTTIQNKFTVPSGLVVTTTAFENHVRQHPEIAKKVVQLGSHGLSVAEFVAVGEEIQALLKETRIEPQLTAEINKFVSIQEDVNFAVRSSAVGEDGSDLSSAGQLESLLNVQLENLYTEFDDGTLTDKEIFSTANLGEVVGFSQSPYEVTQGAEHFNKIMCMFLRQYEVMQKDRLPEISIGGQPLFTDEMFKQGAERYELLPKLFPVKRILDMLKAMFIDSYKTRKAIDQRKLEIMALAPVGDITVDRLFEITEKQNHLKAVILELHAKATVWSSFTYVLVGMLIRGTDHGDMSQEMLSDLAKVFSNNPSEAYHNKKLAAAIVDDGLENEFSSLEEKEATEIIRTKGKKSKDQLQQFLSVHGHRGSKELYLRADGWGDKPETIVSTVRLLISSPKDLKPEAVTVFVIDTLSCKPTGLRRWMMSYLVGETHRGVAAREHAKSILVRATYEQRKTVKRIAKELYNQGFIPDEDLLFFFTQEELKTLYKTRSAKLISRALRRRQIFPELEKHQYEHVRWKNPKPKLAAAIVDDGLENEFSSLEEKEATEIIRTKGKKSKDQLQQFLSVHGHRGSKELYLRADGWGDKPETIVSTVRLLISSPKDLKPEAVTVFVIDTLSCKPTGLRRWMMSYLVGETHRGVAAREHAKSILVRATYEQRKTVKRIAKELYNQGFIPDEDLLFFFTQEELKTLYKTRSAKLISRALRRRQIFPELEKHQYEHVRWGNPKPINNDDNAKLASLLSLSGTVVCEGKVIARARVPYNLEEAKETQPGEILITKCTDICWSPYFPIIKGIVTEIGGLLSHGAVVAREYGLPCLIAVEHATHVFKTGDLVELNTYQGKISKLEQEN